MSQCAMGEIYDEPYRIAFFSERLQEGSQQLIGILNLLCVLADEPNQRGLGLGLVQLLKVGAQCGDDTFI